MDDLIKKMLDTFKHFIHESIRHVWDDIVQSKFNTTPWIDLRGKEEADEELVYSLEAFEMIRTFWMRSVVQEDAAEQLLD